jgi:glucose/arabinose dehydrogenase
MVFLPNGDMLVGERPGRLRVIRDGRLDPTPIGGLPHIENVSISGLFGVTLHPDFANNRLIYFAYAKSRPYDRDLLTLAVARATWDGGDSLNGVEDIFVAKDWYSSAMAAANNRCCGQGPANGSFGGRIAFGPDGKLYVTSGDRNWGEMAQNPDSDLGKILRLNDDGSIPDDNPFAGVVGYLPEIYSLGHRNELGLRFDPATGDLWESEFGPRGGDEVNKIVEGGNYGWFLITRGEHYNDDQKLAAGDNPRFIDPVAWWPSGGNPGNVIVYRGDRFPAWQGQVFVTAMSPPNGLMPGLIRLQVDADGNLLHEERMLTEIGQRMRDVVEGPDGRIYVATEAAAFASPGGIIVLEPGR